MRSMKETEQSFVELTRRAINQIHGDDGFFDGADWKSIYELAYKNGIAAVLLDAAKEYKSLPEDIRKQWEAIRLQVFLKQGKNTAALMSLLHEIEGAGIDYAVFKGPALAAYYPNPLYRSSCDSDILVDTADRPKVSEMILNRGYRVMEHETKKHVFVYKNDATGHKVELHTSVFEDYEGAKIDALKNTGIDCPEHRIDIKVDGGNIRTFGINEQLIYLFYHMIKHFVLEGAQVKYFTDIVLYINKNIDSIDLPLFWDVMEKCGYTRFCENFFTICVRNFGLNETILEGHRVEADEKVLEALLLDYIYLGDENELRGDSWQLTATMEPYFVGERTTIKKSKSGRVINYLFPKPSELNENYEYAKKFPILLPIAWIHRAVRKVLWELFERNEESYTGRQKVEIVEARLGLLGSVGLLDEEE